METNENSSPLQNLFFEGIQSVKKSSVERLLITFFSALLVLVAIVMISKIFKMPFTTLTSDPASIAGISPLSGILSNLGIVLWCAATTASTLAAMILRNGGRRNIYIFLLNSSLLSAFLMFDDLLQFHEDLSSEIGLNQKIVYVLYAVALISYLFYFKKILLQTKIASFLAALSFLFLSILADTIVYKVFGGKLGDWLYLIEDGAKWIGIVFWCYFFLSTSFRFIVKSTENPELSPLNP